MLQCDVACCSVFPLSTLVRQHQPTQTFGCGTYQWVMAHIRMSHGTPMIESCHTYVWVMAHIWLSQVTQMNETQLRQSRGCWLWYTCEWVMAHTYSSVLSPGTHMNESWHTYAWVMLHIYMSHGTHMTKSCDTHSWAEAPTVSGLLAVVHMWMSHGTHTFISPESWHTYDWVMSHIRMSHGTHMTESCDTHTWAKAPTLAVVHMWMSHGTQIYPPFISPVTRMNVSCHKYAWVMAHIWLHRVTHMNAPQPWVSRGCYSLCKCPFLLVSADIPMCCSVQCVAVCCSVL